MAELQGSLQLQAGGKFSVESTADDGTSIVTGTWTVRDNIITLQATKVVVWDKKNPTEKEIILKDSSDILFSVDKEKQLTELPPKNAEGEAKMFKTKLKKIK